MTLSLSPLTSHHSPFRSPSHKPLPQLDLRPHSSSRPPTPGTGRSRPKEGVMARPYEVVYIFDPALDEETINQKLTHFHSLVQVPGADAPQLNHWGKRTLSYPIRKRDTGYYVVANFAAEGASLPEFERA